MIAEVRAQRHVAGNREHRDPRVVQRRVERHVAYYVACAWRHGPEFDTTDENCARAFAPDGSLGARVAAMIALLNAGGGA